MKKEILRILKEHEIETEWEGMAIQSRKYNQIADEIIILINKTMFKHGLGKTAKDKITGFEGVITSRVEFLTGCNRYCIQPIKLKDGKPLDSLYFDEDQLMVVGEGIDAKMVKGKKPGACAPNPSK